MQEQISRANRFDTSTTEEEQANNDPDGFPKEEDFLTVPKKHWKRMLQSSSPWSYLMC